MKNKPMLLALILLWAVALLRLPGEEFWVRADHGIDLLLGQREFGGVRVTDSGLSAIPEPPDPEITEANIAAVNAFARAHPASRVYLALVPHKSGQEDLLRAMARIPEKLEGVTWVSVSPGADGYYATDSHWNAQGAARGWAAIAEAMHITPGEYTEYCLGSGFYGPLAHQAGHFFRQDSLSLLLPRTRVRILGNGQVWDDTGTDLFGIFPNRGLSLTTTAGTGRSLLLLGDEWGGALVPLVYPHFDRISYALSAPEAGFTDVVIVCSAENFLSGLLPAFG